MAASLAFACMGSSPHLLGGYDGKAESHAVCGCDRKLLLKCSNPFPSRALLLANPINDTVIIACEKRFIAYLVNRQRSNTSTAG